MDININKITEKEYEEILIKHDWYYEMSDDPRVYESGQYYSRIINNLSNKNEAFNALYKKYKKSIY